MGKPQVEDHLYDSHPVVTTVSHSGGTPNNVDDAALLSREPTLIEAGYRDGKSVLDQLFSSPFIVLCAAAAAIGGFSFGFDQGLIAVVLTTKPFSEQFPEIDPAATSGASFYKGLMTAMLELGAFLGAAGCGFTSDKWGRRKTLLLGVIWFNLGGVLQASSYHYVQLVIGRLVGGIGVGTLAAVAPVYISETAPPNIRGALLFMESWMIIIGVVVAYYTSYGTRNIPNDWCFRIPFIVQMVPAVILGFCFLFLPYSPRWLVKVGREQEAHRNLCRLRRLEHDHPLVLAELITIKAESKVQKMAQMQKHPGLVDAPSFASQLKLEVLNWIDCFQRGAIKRTHVAIGLGFFQQFLGINALIYYGPSLFAALGMEAEMQLNMAGVMNICQMVGGTPVLLLMDKIGRRPLVIFGSAVVTTCHAIIAGLIGAYGLTWTEHQSAAWVCVALIFCFMLVFGGTWAPVPWVQSPELFPSTLRAKGTALATCSIWINNFIIGLISPKLIDTMHGAGAFIFFAIFGAISFVWVLFFVPETKGKTLEDIDDLFNDSKGKESLQLEQTCLQDSIDEVRAAYGMDKQILQSRDYPSSSEDEDKKKELEDSGGVLTLTTTA
ncbi:unnamed protein product [Parajaminaea phylloscopi]